MHCKYQKVYITALKEHDQIVLDDSLIVLQWRAHPENKRFGQDNVMKKDKKIWFIGISRTFWIPTSIEGWFTTIVSIFLLYLIYVINGVSDDIPFSFSRHWPILVEITVVIFGLYWVTAEHVDKRY